MTSYTLSPVGSRCQVRPATKVMTRYTPNSGSGLQDT